MRDSAQDAARPAVQTSNLQGCQACLPLLQSTQRLWLRPLCVELCEAALEHVLDLQFNTIWLCSKRHVRQYDSDAALKPVSDTDGSQS